MFNLFRMDLRRLFRTRSFYIVLGVAAALILMMDFMVAAVSDPDTVDAMQSSGVVVVGGGDAERAQMREELQRMTQLQFVHGILSSGFLLLMTGTGVAVLLSQDFTSGFIKSIAVSGPDRKAYVLEKAVLTGLYSGVLTALTVGLALLGPMCMGLKFRADTFPDILQYTVLLWLPNWAFGMMSLFMVLLTRNSTLGILMSVASGAGLTAALSEVLPHLLNLPGPSSYFLCHVVANQCLPQPYPAQVQMILLCSAGWGLAYLAVSLAAMEKRDI